MITLKDKWELNKIFFVKRIGFNRIFKIQCDITKILTTDLENYDLIENLKKDKNLSFYDENNLKSYRIIENKDFLVNNCISSDIGLMQVLIGKDWENKYNKEKN
jgi:hypothetical protein